MALQVRRHETPPMPDPLQLLTPPPTAGFKRVRFLDDGEESAEDQVEQPGKYTKLGSADFSDKTPGNSGRSTNLSIARSTPLNKHDAFASLALAINSPSSIQVKPFNFMGLPIAIRKKIYALLLTIPALICIRQNHTAFHDEKKAFLYAERRELLPGIAYALAQVTVAGFKFRFSRFRGTNINILRANRAVFAEAKPIMYGANEFEIVCPSPELSPPADFRVPLFPRGYQRQVRKLNVRARSLYILQWVVGCGGYAEIKNAYRGLESLTIIFEMEHSEKGFGKQWKRKEYNNEGDEEDWETYILRLRSFLANSLFGRAPGRAVKVLPSWLTLRVLFDGDRFDASEIETVTTDQADEVFAAEQAARATLKRGLEEAFELLKKRSR